MSITLICLDFCCQKATILNLSTPQFANIFHFQGQNEEHNSDTTLSPPQQDEKARF